MSFVWPVTKFGKNGKNFIKIYNRVRGIGKIVALITINNSVKVDEFSLNSKAVMA